VLGWFGLTVVIVLLIIRLLDPQLRSYPANLPSFMIVAAGMISLAYCVNSLTGFSEVVCHSATQGATYACAIQASLLYVGALASLLYWVAISLHSVAALSWADKSDRLFSWRTQLATHLLCWGLPLLGLVALFVCNAIGSPGNTYCFILGELNSSGLARTRFLRKWLLWTAPVLICLLVGTVALVLLLWQLPRIRDDRTAGRMRLRVLLFAVVFLVLYSIVVAYEIYQTLQAPGIAQEQINWATCVVLKGFNFASECPPQGLFNAPLYWAFLVAIEIEGFVLLLLFGTTPASWNVVIDMYYRARGRARLTSENSTPYQSFTQPGGDM